MLVLWGAVTLVLLIACANIANMLLARTADRRREFAIRVAIGGSRGRVVRQLLTENILIASIGGAAAVLVAMGGVGLLLPSIADFMPRASEVGVDGSVLAFTIGLALVTAVLVSVPPALWITRAEFGGSARADSRGSTDTQERVRGGLVVGQIATGLILLCGASVLAAGFLQLTRRDLGFHPDNLFSFRIELRPRYSMEGQVEFMDQLIGRLKSVPAVTDATVGMPLPLTGDQMAVSFNIRERPTAPTERPSSNMALVAPGYFRTIGTPILEGRDFTDEDDGRHPRVLVVNKAFADRFFPVKAPSASRSSRGPPRRGIRAASPWSAKSSASSATRVSPRADAIPTPSTTFPTSSCRGARRRFSCDRRCPWPRLCPRCDRSSRRSTLKCRCTTSRRSREYCRPAWRRPAFSRSSWRALPVSASC